jgi:hypothetical protein
MKRRFRNAPEGLKKPFLSAGTEVAECGRTDATGTMGIPCLSQAITGKLDQDVNETYG